MYLYGTFQWLVRPFSAVYDSLQYPELLSVLYMIPCNTPNYPFSAVYDSLQYPELLSVLYMNVRDETRHDAYKRVAKRSAFMYISDAYHLGRSFSHTRTEINIHN